MTWLAIVVGMLVATWVVAAYNRLVALQKRADGAWSDIDAQLKRRHDLVPPLVETVKGYAAHERSTLEQVVARRTEATRFEGRPRPDAALAGGENVLVEALRGLFALAEDYPELRADQRFGQLQQQLTEIEDQIQHARRYYNAVVRDLNTRVARFPDLLVARGLGLDRRDFFELDSSQERSAIRVDLDT